MRHAKSSWANQSQSDHERPLNERGLRDAPRMARLLNEQNLIPDLVLTSSAKRALTTAQILVDNLNRSSIELQVVDDFYHAVPETYGEYCLRLADQFERPLIVGHNPGLEQLVNRFTDTWQSMPTAAIAVITLPIENWSDLNLSQSNGELATVFRPKEIA